MTATMTTAVMVVRSPRESPGLGADIAGGASGGGGITVVEPKIRPRHS
jgi:hypothetical protein